MANALEAAGQRLFTVEEANTMLPLVRAIVADLVGLAHDVIDRWDRLSCLLAGRESMDPDDPYAEELVQVGKELEEDCRRLRGYADELLELGVEPKSAVEGLVDFPAIIEGRVVYLCWKLGEPEILFWHEADAEYEDRRRVPARGPAEAGLVGAGEYQDLGI